MCYDEYIRGLMYEGYSKEDAIELASFIFGEKDFVE